MAGWTSAICFFRRAPGSWRFILQWTWWTSESISCEIMAHRPFFSVGLLNFSVLREKCVKIPLQILTCLVLPGLMTGLALCLAKKNLVSPLSVSISTYIWSQRKSKSIKRQESKWSWQGKRQTNPLPWVGAGRNCGILMASKTLRLLTARTCRFRTVHPWQALRQLMKGGFYTLAGPGYNIFKTCICKLESNSTSRLADWLLWDVGSKIRKMRIACSSIDLLMTPALCFAATRAFDRSLHTTHSLSFAKNWWNVYVYSSAKQVVNGHSLAARPHLDILV